MLDIIVMYELKLNTYNNILEAYRSHPTLQFVIGSIPYI